MGLEAFRCFSGWNKLVVGELGATSWLPFLLAGLPLLPWLSSGLTSIP